MRAIRRDAASPSNHIDFRRLASRDVARLGSDASGLCPRVVYEQDNRLGFFGETEEDVDGRPVKSPPQILPDGSCTYGSITATTRYSPGRTTHSGARVVSAGIESVR